MPLAELERRLRHLEEQRRATLDALELAASSGDFEAAPGRFESPDDVLRDTVARVRRLIPFDTLGFWLVDEDSANMVLRLSLPGEAGAELTAEFERLAAESITGLALRGLRGVHVAGRGEGSRLVVHALATAARVRGLMIGSIGAASFAELPDTCLPMLTILLQSAASSLEGLELYSLLRRKNTALRESLARLAAQEEALRREVDARKEAQRRLELMGQAFAHAIEAVLVCDARGRVLEANPAFNVLTGFGHEEIGGRLLRRLVVRYNGRETLRAMVAGLREKGEYAGDIACPCKNGGSFPARLSVGAVPDGPDGTPCYVALFHDMTEDKKKEERIRYQAHHDSLTGLPNRALFQDRLGMAVARAERRNARLGVCFLDIDDFKRINDSMGHQVGDELLCDVARRLTAFMRAGDTVARLGGDEFVIMAEDLRDQADALRVCERITAAFAEPLAAGGVPHHLTVSTGVTVFPDDGVNPQMLIRNADLAMYRAKESGHGRWQLYTRQLTRQAKKRMQTERLLRRAMERGEIEVHFQPQVDFASSRVIGAEALVRWRRKGRLEMPAAFVPQAEESGLITLLGEEVLRQACGHAAHWRKLGHDLRLAVNVSARQFEQGDLSEVVAGIIQESGFPADRLEVELTETALLRSEERVRTVLDKLCALGVASAIDDFGTGYSSLSHLRRFPIRSLKIDRGFVRDLPGDQNNASIVEAILSMARSLGLTVVAEGIETEDHRRFLRARGCDSYQGYLFSPPLPPEEFVRLLEDGARRRPARRSGA
ncbi:diguanylate cyclase/phosphodiesterase with PAS/PAC sensor(s) [Desulfovibrio sp. X2]|nr:diguanylate cyclase/phosphodiesterase with PAS/PAC sensor(s) [Desulfovibrio sp. X2]